MKQFRDAALKETQTGNMTAPYAEEAKSIPAAGFVREICLTVQTVAGIKPCRLDPTSNIKTNTNMNDNCQATKLKVCNQAEETLNQIRNDLSGWDPAIRKIDNIHDTLTSLLDRHLKDVESVPPSEPSGKLGLGVAAAYVNAAEPPAQTVFVNVLRNVRDDQASAQRVVHARLQALEDLIARIVVP